MLEMQRRGRAGLCPGGAHRPEGKKGEERPRGAARPGPGDATGAEEAAT